MAIAAPVKRNIGEGGSRLSCPSIATEYISLAALSRALAIWKRSSWRPTRDIAVTRFWNLLDGYWKGIVSRSTQR